MSYVDIVYIVDIDCVRKKLMLVLNLLNFYLAEKMYEFCSENYFI